MFDPALAGYWGHADHHAAMDVCLDVLAKHAARIDGIKLSLLDKDKELACGRGCPTACACTPATTSTSPN
jgi:hypothetical protein